MNQYIASHWLKLVHMAISLIKHKVLDKVLSILYAVSYIILLLCYYYYYPYLLGEETEVQRI